MADQPSRRRTRYKPKMTRPPGGAPFPEEMPEHAAEAYRDEMKGRLEHWEEFREVLAGEREPQPRLADPETFRLFAEWLRIEPPRRELDSREASAWYYCMEMIAALQAQARMVRLGLPVGTGSPDHDRILADMHDRLADLLRGLLQGNTPKILSTLFKRTKKPPRSPRHVDAATEAVAAARLLVETGRFRTVEEAETWAAERFGLLRETLCEAVRGPLLEQRTVHLRDQLHRLEPREKWQTFLEETVARVAFQYKEENTPGYFPRK